MRWLRFAVFILVVTMLQDSLVGVISVTNLNIKPDLLLILLVFFAIYCNTTDAIITSFVIGFAADIIGPSMGPQMVSFGLFGSLLAYVRRVVDIRKMYYQSIVIFLTAVLVGVLVYFLTFLKGGQPSMPNPDRIWTVILGTAIYSSLVGPFLFLPSAWWMCIRTHRFS